MPKQPGPAAPSTNPRASPSEPLQTPAWIWGIVALLVVIGTVNFVLLSTLYKAFTDEYAFFVNQGINFGYVVMGGLILYPKQMLTDEVRRP